MKTFTTLAFIAFTITLVIGEDFEDFFAAHDYRDVDAFYVAQELNSSTLHPPRGLYETVHKELQWIRAAHPEVAGIHHRPREVPGQVFMTNYDLSAIHRSQWGPISTATYAFTSMVPDKKTYLVTFKRPYSVLTYVWNDAMDVYVLEGGAHQIVVDNLPVTTRIIREADHLFRQVKYTFNVTEPCFDYDKCKYTDFAKQYVYTIDEM